MDVQVTAEVLTVDGRNHPVGRILIRLEAEKLSVMRNGSLLGQFKYKKIHFTEENRKGPDYMLLQSDGLKFIFKSNDETTKSIRQALSKQNPLLKAAAMKPSLSGTTNGGKDNDLDANIQNINPNRGTSKTDSNPRGRTGTSLMDLPKPPSRAANMRLSNARPTMMISAEHNGRSGQNEAPRTHHMPHSRLQISGTKSVSVGRASMSPQSMQDDNTYDPREWDRASQDSIKSPSRESHLYHLESPLPLPPLPFKTSTHTSPAQIKKQPRESPLQKVYNTLKLFSNDERRSQAKKVGDSSRLRDQPKMNALPPSSTEMSRFSPYSILPRISVEEQEMKSNTKPTISSSDKVKSTQGLGKLSFFSTDRDRSYKNPERRLDNREISEKIRQQSSSSNSSDNSSNNNSFRIKQGLFPRAPITTTTTSYNKDEDDAKDMARAIADSVITADAEKEKSFQNLTYDLENYNSIVGNNNENEVENSLKIEKRGRYEGMRNLGNTCYLASISQVCEVYLHTTSSDLTLHTLSCISC